MSVCLKLKISVNTAPIGLRFSSGNIPSGAVMVLSNFLGKVGQPQPPQKRKMPPPKFFFIKLKLKKGDGWSTNPPLQIAITFTQF